MNLKKKICSAVLAAVCALTFSACSTGESSGTSDSSDEGTLSSSVESSSGESSSTDDSTPGNDEDSVPEAVRVAALKGPTAMGMTKLMDDDETEDLIYDFTIAASADEITPLIVQGSIDIACVPANLGAVLYQKTEGNVSALAINTLGVLYICENGNSVNSVEDLKGKTIYASGKGSTPEYALTFILENSGIADEVTVEWKSEHSECLAALLTNENSVAMLPQPFVTTAQMNNENVRVAIDLNDAWDDLGLSSSLLTGIVIVNKSFAEEYPSAVAEFLERYSDSVEYVNSNVESAAELVEKYNIVTAAVAQKAIPECHIVCITGEEMKSKLSGYLQVLFDQLPSSVGGAMPDDDFYYAG